MKCDICGNDFPTGAMHNVQFKKNVFRICDTCYKRSSKTEEYFEKIDKGNEKFFMRGSNENTDK